VIRDRYVVGNDQEVVRVADLVRWVTRRHELVVVVDFDWNPAILFQARRRGVVLRPWLENPRTNALLAAHPFRVVVAQRDHQMLFGAWKARREVGQVGPWHVFRVGDDSSDLDLPRPRRPG
jgi:hypothetical protein